MQTGSGNSRSVLPADQTGSRLLAIALPAGYHPRGCGTRLNSWFGRVLARGGRQESIGHVWPPVRVPQLADGYGLADGFQIVFCEVPNPEPDGTICVLAVMRADEPLTAITLEILRGREGIARERLSVDSYPEL